LSSKHLVKYTVVKLLDEEQHNQAVNHVQNKHI